MWFRELSLFWKIVLGSLGAILIGFISIAVMAGVNGAKAGESSVGRESTTTADLSAVKEAMSSSNEQDRVDAELEAENYESKSPDKEDMSTFLKDYETKIPAAEESLEDGIYVFYDKTKKSADIIKDKVGEYVKAGKGYKVIPYYMNDESSGIAGLTVLARLLEDKSVWTTHDFPEAIFVRNNSVVTVYKQGNPLEELPRNYVK